VVSGAVQPIIVVVSERSDCLFCRLMG